MLYANCQQGNVNDLLVEQEGVECISLDSITLLACLATTFCVYTLFGLRSLALGGPGMGTTDDFLYPEGARTLSCCRVA